MPSFRFIESDRRITPLNLKKYRRIEFNFELYESVYIENTGNVLDIWLRWTFNVASYRWLQQEIKKKKKLYRINILNSRSDSSITSTTICRFEYFNESKRKKKKENLCSSSTNSQIESWKIIAQNRIQSSFKLAQKPNLGLWPIYKREIGNE